MKRIINPALVIIFFSFMLILSTFARDIHNYLIPNVSVKRLSQEEFPVTFTIEGGQEIISYKKKLAIPKEIYDKGEIYAITEKYINGEKRNAARRIFLEVGDEYEGFYEVVSGISTSDFVITDSNKPLAEGDEVYLLPGNYTRLT